MEKEETPKAAAGNLLSALAVGIAGSVIGGIILNNVSIIPAETALSVGWTLLIAGGATLLICGVLLVLYRKGQDCRPHKSLSGFGILLLSTGAALVLSALAPWSLNPERVYLRARLTPKNLDRPRWHVFAGDAEGLSLSVQGSGFEGPMFDVELEQKIAKTKAVQKLEIHELERASVRESSYYKIMPGDFNISGQFKRGDTITLRTINGTGFRGRITLKIHGPRTKSKEQKQ